jgi:hypothetical protein
VLCNKCSKYQLKLRLCGGCHDTAKGLGADEPDEDDVPDMPVVSQEQ